MLPRTLFYTTVFAAATLAQYGEDPSETDSSDPALQSAQNQYSNDFAEIYDENQAAFSAIDSAQQALPDPTSGPSYDDDQIAVDEAVALGQPVPTDNYILSALPSDVRGAAISILQSAAAIASADLKGYPALTSELAAQITSGDYGEDGGDDGGSSPSSDDSYYYSDYPSYYDDGGSAYPTGSPDSATSIPFGGFLIGGKPTGSTIMIDGGPKPTSATATGSTLSTSVTSALGSQSGGSGSATGSATASSSVQANKPNAASRELVSKYGLGVVVAAVFAVGVLL